MNSTVAENLIKRLRKKKFFFCVFLFSAFPLSGCKFRKLHWFTLLLLYFILLFGWNLNKIYDRCSLSAIITAKKWKTSGGDRFPRKTSQFKGNYVPGSSWAGCLSRTRGRTVFALVKASELKPRFCYLKKFLSSTERYQSCKSLDTGTEHVTGRCVLCHSFVPALVPEVRLIWVNLKLFVPIFSFPVASTLTANSMFPPERSLLKVFVLCRRLGFGKDLAPQELKRKKSWELIHSSCRYKFLCTNKSFLHNFRTVNSPYE